MLGMRSLLNAEMPQTGDWGREHRHKRDEHAERADGQGRKQAHPAPEIAAEKRAHRSRPQTRKRIVPFTRPSRRSAAKEKSGDLAAPSPSVIDSMLMLAPGIARATAAWR